MREGWRFGNRYDTGRLLREWRGVVGWVFVPVGSSNPTLVAEEVLWNPVERSRRETWGSEGSEPSVTG